MSATYNNTPMRQHPVDGERHIPNNAAEQFIVQMNGERYIIDTDTVMDNHGKILNDLMNQYYAANDNKSRCAIIKQLAFYVDTGEFFDKYPEFDHETILNRACEML